MNVKEVRIEYLGCPVGLDTPHPLISWNIGSSEAADRQSAYRVCCVLEHTGETVWDTGKVEGDTASVVYGGKGLEDFSRYLVSVVVWDKADTSSEPASASFTTAFVSGTFDQQARWIAWNGTKWFPPKKTAAGEAGENSETKSKETIAQGVYLRRGFELKGGIRDAWAAVCGLGYYHFYLNGRHVGDRILDPAQTDYHKRALYAVFDVKEYLAEGFNACLVSLGNGRQVAAYGFDPLPRMIFRLHVRYGDGTVETLVSDDTWRCSSGPVKQNSIYAGETCDARDELSGWEQKTYDTTAWESAAAVSGYPLEAQVMPPIRYTERFRPRRLRKKPGGTWIVDFGQNMSGYVSLTIRGAERGHTVTLRFSELLDEEGNLLRETSSECEDRYICRGGGPETFTPSFTYHGFRYAEVIDYPGVLQKEDLRALVFHTDLERAGRFHCSHELLNRIHENIVWSQRANVMSIPTDCPQRNERMGWLGDVQLVSEQAVYNFNMAAFYRKFLDDIRLSQREDGALSDVTPAYWPLYPADPAWGSAYATLLWKLYFYYDDTPSLIKHYPHVRRYIDFLFNQNKDGVLRDVGKYGDWCPPASTFPKQTPMDLSSSWFMLKDTKIAAEIAGIIGNRREAEELSARAAYLTESFNRAFNDHGLYATTRMSPIDNHPGVTSQILPLALGIVPPEDEKRAVELLVEAVERRFNYHADCGIVGIRYLFPVLEKYGHTETVFKILSRKTYPSFGYMVEQGATTLWERWEYLAGKGMNSHNHIMYGSVDSWFYRYLCGIIPLEPGWKRIRVSPRFPSGINNAHASLDTIRGPVEVKWERTGDRTIDLSVRLPAGIRAGISLPGGAKFAGAEVPAGTSDEIPLAPGHTRYRVSLSD
ncbi:MAG: glycoside hydrolase family 78 protein [Treponema sp.]|jgi:alpha-L-rhamnosidase|nr:glycoside hydrolase family 78 protein [Treponema sp.]